MTPMTGSVLSRELIRINPDEQIIISHRMNDKKAKSKSIKAFVMKPFLLFEIAKPIRLVRKKK